MKKWISLFFRLHFSCCTPTNLTKQTLKTWNSDSKGPLEKTFFLSLWKTQIWNITINQIDWRGITKRQTGHNIKINLVFYSEERRWNKIMLLFSIELCRSALDLYNKTCVTGHAQQVDDWFTNFRTFGKRQIQVRDGKQLLPVLFCQKLLVSISKFCQVLKAEMKKCVIRIAAIHVDLQKESKNTSFIKTSRSSAFSCWPAYNHSFNTNPFLQPFKCLESYVPNVSLAVWTPGVTCLKFFVSHSNGWHHPFQIFC